MRRILVLAALAALILTGATASPTHAAQVLILGPTVIGGPSSLEATTAAGLGLTPVIATTATAWGTGLANASSYKAIILGDPDCAQNTTAPLAWAISSANALAAAVTGNVVIIGTDSTLHSSSGGAQLWKSAINFAASGSGTGAVISLSCYYDYGGAPTPTAVPVLGGFGTFIAQQADCANNIAIVATSPALASLSSADLSSWGCSVHEGFTSWPTGATGFTPLAVATDSSIPHSFTAANGVSGFPYILARGVTPVTGEGLIKVCKVAGLGVPVGASFSFAAGSSTLTVPAGPSPGGTCAVGPTYPVGSTVTVTETIPAGHVVSSITVAPAAQLAGPPNLASGSVTVVIGNGVTEVTYTDKRTGFLEICKRGKVSGSFRFTVNPGGLGPFVVPAGACSPAIEVPAGQVLVTEAPARGILLIGCATIPAGQQGPCNLATQTSTVTVAPGDISSQTIALFTNRRTVHGLAEEDADDHH